MVEKLIKKIAQRLDEDKITYMVIGGQAVLLYGRPRLTRDIDITLGIDMEDFSLIKKACESLRLKILPEKPEDFARETRVLPAEEEKSKIRVDFVFSFSEYERQALERTKQVQMDGYPVRFASCEDVIIHKMVAGRAIDEEDVKSILAKNKDSIDMKYIKKWLLELSNIDECKQVVQKFDALLRQ